MKKKLAIGAGVLILAGTTLFSTSPAFAASPIEINIAFDTPNQLDSYFDIYNPTGQSNDGTLDGTIEQTTTGGIGDTGALHAIGSSGTNAVIQPKASYTVGPVGSTYIFSSYIRSVGNSGYSGLGFTATTPSAATDSGTPFRPNDALGVSVHGGGFVFHNGATDTNGSWASDNAGITTVTKSSNGALLNSGSPDDWYKIVLRIVKSSATTFDMHLEVWPVLADGSLINSGAADAIFEMNNQTNSTLMNATGLHTYFNFSGYRVDYFDGYSTTLEGGPGVNGELPPGTVTGDAPGNSESGSGATPELARTGVSESAVYATLISAFGMLTLGSALRIARRRKN